MLYFMISIRAHGMIYICMYVIYTVSLLSRRAGRAGGAMRGHGGDHREGHGHARGAYGRLDPAPT